jgi:PLP dependent protein
MITDKLYSIQNEIQQKIKELNFKDYNPTIIAVSKNFSINKILPLINDGHLNFGENKVQEALEKWIDIKKDFSSIKLHLIGKLQTNKAKYAVSLFDYIHSLDNFKLAQKLANEEIKQNKRLKYFIQINIGEEDQKNGILEDRIIDFYFKCKNELNLNIIGLMCIPPEGKNPNNHFFKMREILNQLKLNELSMGMSSDYLQAIENKSTFLRIGSKIFGNRN